MKRRDFLKVSLTAGVATALPINVFGHTDNSDNDTHQNGDKPDLSGAADILILGNIITVDENKLFADAMTIKNGYVQYVGNEQKARKLCDSHTVEKKYPKGLTIYPGFMEAHCHGMSVGLLESTIKLFDCNSFSEYQKTIKDYIAKHPGQDVYRISGWRNIGGQLPTAKLLDEVTPEGVCILGGSMDGHCFWVNSNCLKLIDETDPHFYDKYTPLEVPKDSNGRPTGYFSESAASDIQKLIPISMDTAKNSILAWQQFAFKHGLVAATEAGVNLASTFADAYSQLAKEGKLQFRTRAYWNVVMDQANEETVAMVERMSKEQNNEYYKVVGLKIFIDGVVESHTALLTKAYEDKKDSYGLDRYKDATGDPDATLKKLVLTAHQHGLPTHTHTIGDGAVKKMLDAIEYAKSTTGDYSIRDMLAHIELIRTQDIKRFAQLNVSAIVSALWSPKNAITPFGEELGYLGERATTNYQVMNSFVKMGVNCAQHSDYPVSQAFGIPRAIYCGITRRLPGGGKDTERLAEEAVTRLEMLKELTINVAKLWKEENHMGSLTPGKMANYVVYDCDFIDDDVEKIPGAVVQEVVVDGKEVYHV